MSTATKTILKKRVVKVSCIFERKTQQNISLKYLMAFPVTYMS